MPLRPLLFCLLLAPALCLAQSADEACLRAFAAVLSPDTPLTADFSMQKRLPGMSQALPAAGRLSVDPRQGLIWQTTFPLQEVRVFGRTRYAVTNEKGELQVRELPTDQIAALLTQTPEALAASLKSRFFVTCTQKAGESSLILSPKPGAPTGQLSEIALHAKEATLTRTSLAQSDGAVTHIVFTHVRKGASVSSSDAALFERVR